MTMAMLRRPPAPEEGRRPPGRIRREPAPERRRTGAEQALGTSGGLSGGSKQPQLYACLLTRGLAGAYLQPVVAAAIDYHSGRGDRAGASPVRSCRQI